MGSLCKLEHLTAEMILIYITSSQRFNYATSNIQSLFNIHSKAGCRNHCSFFSIAYNEHHKKWLTTIHSYLITPTACIFWGLESKTISFSVILSGFGPWHPTHVEQSKRQEEWRNCSTRKFLPTTNVSRSLNEAFTEVHRHEFSR